MGGKLDITIVEECGGKKGAARLMNEESAGPREWRDCKSFMGTCIGKTKGKGKAQKNTTDIGKMVSPETGERKEKDSNACQKTVISCSRDKKSPETQDFSSPHDGSRISGQGMTEARFPSGNQKKMERENTQKKGGVKRE